MAFYWLKIFKIGRSRGYLLHSHKLFIILVGIEINIFKDPIRDIVSKNVSQFYNLTIDSI